MNTRHTFSVVILSLFFVIIGTTGNAEIPQVITIQGRLTDSTGAVVGDGDYSMTFTIYDDSVGAHSLWVCRDQKVHVENGLFVYQLGSNCNLPDNLFVGDTVRWLGIQVGDDAEIAPRTRLTSASYVYHALRADTALYVAGGAVGGWVDNGTVVTTETATDSVGVGVTAPVSKLDVDGDINTSTRYQIGGETVLSNDADKNLLIGKGAAVIATGGEKNTFVGESTAPHNGGSNNVFVGYATGYWNNSGSYNTYIGSAAGFNAQGSNNVFIGKEAGYNVNGSDKLYIANSQSGTPLIYGDFSSGRVGFGTTSPGAVVHAVSSGTTALKGENSTLFGRGVMGEATGIAGSGVYGNAEGSLGVGVRGYATGSNGVGVRGEAAADSSHGVEGITNARFGKGVYGEGNATRSSGGWFVGNGWGSYGVYCEATEPSSYALHAVADNADAGAAVHAVSKGSTPVALEAVAGLSGLAARFFGNVRILGTDSTTVMELGVGLDYAEGFDVSAPAAVEPGMVLIIDPTSPGKLTVSSQPYDTKVAGIVAGAEGLKSGIRLGADQFDHDVALAGRVYCYVDATQHEVIPGDLLTTSATPGYAMKVTDYSRAKGAVLGKAMQRLAKGTKGKILVLVTLQ